MHNKKKSTVYPHFTRNGFDNRVHRSNKKQTTRQLLFSWIWLNSIFYPNRFYLFGFCFQRKQTWLTNGWHMFEKEKKTELDWKTFHHPQKKLIPIPEFDPIEESQFSETNFQRDRPIFNNLRILNIHNSTNKFLYTHIIINLSQQLRMTSSSKIQEEDKLNDMVASTLTDPQSNTSPFQLCTYSYVP